MKQPTREEITQKVEKVLKGQLTREEICIWAVNYIRNDEQICIDDLEAWHYLVEISNIDEMIEPNKYLFHEDDIQAMVKKYIYPIAAPDSYRQA
ncbi:MAG: hypothetical protein BHW30_05555 [Firmicutes bacterium CAG_194_44_15]|nr:MAG: hypothetical protein BHW30_05555 [Firmicutes bacterium CAG_194_44_15]